MLGRTPWKGPNWKETRADCNVFFSTRAGAQESPGESPQNVPRCALRPSSRRPGPPPVARPALPSRNPQEQVARDKRLQMPPWPQTHLSVCVWCVCVWRGADCAGKGWTRELLAARTAPAKFGKHARTQDRSECPAPPHRWRRPPAPRALGVGRQGRPARIPQRPPQSPPPEPQSPALTALG